MKYTASQKQAIESEARYLCVDAGAGSGKTRVLVDRIVHLLRTGKARLEEIVAITFTEKAALEMKERLRKAFRACAPRDDPAAFSFWRDLERRVDTAQITTIHAFCSRLLRENALYLGLDPDFGMIADAENALMMQDAIDSVVLDGITREDPAVLRLASEFSLSQLHGLCRTLLRDRGTVDRIRRRGGLETSEAVRETWEAMAEAEQERYLAALGRHAAVNNFLLALRDFDGICDDPEESREQWRSDMVSGFEAMQTGLAPDEVETLLRTFLKNPYGNGKKKLWPSEEAYDALAALQKKVTEFVKKVFPDPKKDLCSDELVARSAELTADLLQLEAAVNAAFARAKQDAGLLDFDDLVLLALRVLRENGTLRGRTAARVKYLLLDEFQDTDGLQLEIARLLHGEEDGPDLFIVGDPKQSIYYFRGADVEIFQAEREAAAELVGLDQNFRSLPGVLDFANDFFTRSNLLCAVERYHPMAVHRATDAQARVGFILSDPPEDKKWNVEEHRAAEAARIAARIQQLCAPDSDATVFDGHTDGERRPEYGDIALLFRASSHVGLYEEALRKAGIPYVVVAGAGFYERQEVVDVINLLKILADPWDEPALLGYLRGPIVALPDDDLVRLCQQGGLAEMALGEDLPDGLDHPERLERARDIYTRLRAHLREPLPDLVDRLLEETGIEAILLGQFLGLQKASNVRKIAAVAREQAGRGHLGLRAFVNYLDEVRTREIREGEAGLQPDGQGAVTLMTIHKSKGLEFPVVFLPDMAQVPRGNKEHTLQMHRELGITLRLAEEEGDRSDTRLGHYIKRRIKEEESAESARVLYVALTRARDLLYLCGQSDARLGSWFHAFDAIYHVTDRAAGEVIAGDTWKAVVFREIPELPRARPDASAGTQPFQSEHAALDVEAIRRRIAPVPEPAPAPASISVSRLLARMETGGDGDEEPGEDEQPRFERDPTYAMDRGTLVHRMFELWDFASGQAPDIQSLVRAARMGLGHRAQLEADLQRIQDWFSASVLGLFVEDGGRVAHSDAAQPPSRLGSSDARRGTEPRGLAGLGQRLKNETNLLREQPFSLRIGDTLVNGTIDLALEDGTIIDYKTGKVKDSTSGRYETQLLLYAAAMRELTGTAPEIGMLVYVDPGKVVEVALTADRVDAVLRDCHDALSG